MTTIAPYPLVPQLEEMEENIRTSQLLATYYQDFIQNCQSKGVPAAIWQNVTVRNSLSRDARQKPVISFDCGTVRLGSQELLEARSRVQQIVSALTRQLELAFADISGDPDRAREQVERFGLAVQPHEQPHGVSAQYADGYIFVFFATTNMPKSDTD